MELLEVHVMKTTRLVKKLGENVSVKRCTLVTFGVNDRKHVEDMIIKALRMRPGIYTTRNRLHEDRLEIGYDGFITRLIALNIVKKTIKEYCNGWSMDSYLKSYLETN